jgi:YHS domain-containing protein
LLIPRDLGGCEAAKEEKGAMKPENTELKWDEHCAVCGKSVGHSEGFSHLNIEGEMIALCCPLCFETFEKDPAKYLRLRAARKIAEDTRPPGSFSPFDL